MSAKEGDDIFSLVPGLADGMTIEESFIVIIAELKRLKKIEKFYVKVKPPSGGH